MKKYTVIKIIFFAIIAFERCESQSKYIEPCAGQYGSQGVIDSLVRRYNFNNAVYFAESYARSNPPKNPNCETIHLRIQSDTIPFPYTDTFAISVAKVFFSDSSNNKVKYLDITLIDYWPAIAQVETKFLVDRVNLQDTYISESVIETNDMQFKIEKEQPYTETSSDGKEEGMRIIVRVSKDYKDISKLATRLRSQYDTIIKEKKLYHFDIDLIIDSPAGKLCTSKTYYFFYTKRNKNI